VNALAFGPAPGILLDRHQQRREAGLPTVSVLSGPAGLAIGAGRRWAGERGRGVVEVTPDEPRAEVLIAAWVDALAASRDLEQDAVAWLARHLDRPARELGAAMGRKTPLERAAFLEVALTDDSDVAAGCRRLLTTSLKTVGRGEDVSACEGVLKALHGLVPPGATPALLAARPATVRDPSAWIGPAAASLARLAEAEPRLTLVLATEPEVLAAYLACGPESRARALLRAGIVPVSALDAAEIGRRLHDALAGAAARLSGPIRRLAADGASEGLVDLFREAARATAAPPPGAALADDDPARSAAERFLFERLETLPRTAGRFALNARVDIPFGPASTMEVDLVAQDLALAIEIDGYYHFRDADAYRRDRRKDVALQERGFLVVRVLAEDVVGRLEEVLDRILAAVAAREGHGHGHGPHSQDQGR
jgi:hypothetical protein